MQLAKNPIYPFKRWFFSDGPDSNEQPLVKPGQLMANLTQEEARLSEALLRVEKDDIGPENTHLGGIIPA